MNVARWVLSRWGEMRRGVRLLRGLRPLLALLLMLAVGAARSGETVTYYHTDALGSPVAATDAHGGLLWTEHYRPYGERMERGGAGAAGHRIAYTGKVHDESTGLADFGARYYDPVVGRFMGVDPAGFDEGNLHSFNAYAYGNNNPYRYVDPDGRESVEVGAWGGMNSVEVAMQNPGAVRFATTVLGIGLSFATGAGMVGTAADALGLPFSPKDLGSRIAKGLVTRGLSEGDLVARGGANITPESIARGTATHPTAGVRGFSAQAKPGADLCELCTYVPNNQVGVTTVGNVRRTGGDVIPTPGRGNHVTVTGLDSNDASRLLSPSQPNPVPPHLRRR